MTKRLVRGLFDYMEAKSNGEEFEFEEPSESYIPGLGLGATDEARRWAWRGYLVEQQEGLEHALRKKRGRPRKSAGADIDCWRAYLCWLFVGNLPGPPLSNRDAIEMVRNAENKFGLPNDKRAFPATTTDDRLEQSLSRGKRKLGFTGKWTCSTCEEIAPRTLVCEIIGVI